MSGWKRWLGYGAVAVGGAAAFILVLEWAPDWFAETDGLDAKERRDARQGIRTVSLGLLAGTFTAVTAVLAARTYRLNRVGQRTDRLTKAIEQLGHDADAVRLGGIYALERVARESKEDHHHVVEVLITYLRDHAPKSGAAELRDTAPQPTPGVRAVLKVLGRRTLVYEQDVKPHLNLSSLHLMGADLQGADLSGSDLRGTDLTDANLTDAKLDGAVYDRHTRWPDDVDRVARGARTEDAPLPGF
ncbi:MAG TPA: pentapeptide repeat-containing protein [Thermoleophilaceae bacterium]|jgi:hypothetical protein